VATDRSWITGEPATVDGLPADLGATDTEVIKAKKTPPTEWRVQ
jgi:hypothetical protein